MCSFLVTMLFACSLRCSITKPIVLSSIKPFGAPRKAVSLAEECHYGRAHHLEMPRASFQIDDGGGSVQAAIFSAKMRRGRSI